MNGDFLAELSALMEKHGVTLWIEATYDWDFDGHYRAESRTLVVERCGRTEARIEGPTIRPVDLAIGPAGY
jgi:hypothetical protein